MLTRRRPFYPIEEGGGGLESLSLKKNYFSKDAVGKFVFVIIIYYSFHDLTSKTKEIDAVMSDHGTLYKTTVKMRV